MFLAASLSPLGSTMIAVALPSIGSELGVGSGVLTQWLVSSYLIVGIATMSPGGKLGDRIGHSRCLLIGMGIYGAEISAKFSGGRPQSLLMAKLKGPVSSAEIVDVRGTPTFVISQLKSSYVAA